MKTKPHRRRTLRLETMVPTSQDIYELAREHGVFAQAVRVDPPKPPPPAPPPSGKSAAVKQWVTWKGQSVRCISIDDATPCGECVRIELAYYVPQWFLAAMMLLNHNLQNFSLAPGVSADRAARVQVREACASAESKARTITQALVIAGDAAPMLKPHHSAQCATTFK